MGRRGPRSPTSGARCSAEHLAKPIAEVERAVAEEGLIAAIERLNQGRGRLRRHPIQPDAGPKESIAATTLLDPGEPPDLDYLRRWLREWFQTE